MNTNAGHTRPAVELIGVKACQILSPGSRGRVLAGRSRAIYLLSGGGELAWLAPADVPMHRRAVRLTDLFSRPADGSTYSVSDDGHLVGLGAALDLRSGAIWDPPRRDGRQAPPTGPGWHRRLAGALMRQLPQPRGFGSLLPWIMDPSREAPVDAVPGGSDDSIPAHAFVAAQYIACACADGDLQQVLAHAGDLLGLGGGLTPCGDDFLGGILFGLATLGWMESALAPPGMVSAFLEWSGPRTSTISHALLRDYATGQGPEALEQFTNGLLERWPVQAMRRMASALIGLGHSTGWSLMAGAWIALALTPVATARKAAAPARDES